MGTKRNLLNVKISWVLAKQTFLVSKDWILGVCVRWPTWSTSFIVVFFLGRWDFSLLEKIECQAMTG